MVVSQNKGTQYRPQYTIVLVIGTPKKVRLILGNSHIGKPQQCKERQPTVVQCVAMPQQLPKDRQLEFFTSNMGGFMDEGLGILPQQWRIKWKEGT